MGVLAALLLTVLGLGVGSTGDAALWPWAASGDSSAQLILWEIRLPRTLGAWLAGALLGLSGVIAQGLFRNPLADPYLMGGASGAGLGVALFFLAGPASVAAIGWAGHLGLTGAAFLGACGALVLCLMLSRGRLQTETLLLSGVVVAFVLSSLTSLLLLASPEAWRSMQFFLMGNTSLLGWPSVLGLTLALGVCLIPALMLARGLDALILGEDTAQSLGVPLSRLRWILLILMGLATASAVAQVGVVGFVGLVAPHWVRRMTPMTHRGLLWASTLCGGALLQMADVLSRGLIPPEELPVGILTACLGGGYLLLLLWRRQGRVQ